MSKQMFFLSAAATLAMTLAAPAVAAMQAAPPAAAPQTASTRLATLFEASDQASLKRNPMEALSRGDSRTADHLGDYLTDEYSAAERAAAEQELAALGRIDREALNPSERISYDVFKWQRELDLRGLQPAMLALTEVRPLDHFGSIHTSFAQLSSGDSIAPFKTVRDYDNGLSRIDDYVAILDRSIVRMPKGW